MVRVACIDPKSGEVINVIVAESLEKVPDVVAVREDGIAVKKDEVILKETEVGSVGDIYMKGKGFYRFVGE